ncbi:hypothetical protein QFW80_16735 [Luteimonas sp. M1R5S18]|uniref:Uncharacterized protein n=1 Tax=Luteimonas rhizosphaericola TaxID=3042024 RepID=A0ABT6JNA4_9GAMM|nr:hypothetical protein [Luteimonas rhizosphaericola]MDH5832166.1 hypothetical protein [Luteimonas rhizosphaericola]
MAGILSKLSVKPLLYAVGVLLVACAGLGGALAVQQRWYGGQLATVTAARNTAQVSAEAWKVRAGELDLANAAFQDVNETLQGLLAKAQGENTRLQDEGRAAIAAAQAAAAAANRTLDTWLARYADQVRKGDCASALNAVQQACPAFNGY